MKFDNYSIRLLQESDLESYFELVEKNRKRLEDFFTGTTSKTQTLESTRIFLLEMLEKIKAKAYFPYLVIDDEKKNIIGFFDIKNIDWNIPKAELGCYIDSDYASKGITTKAARLFCEHCFSEYKFLKLFLRTHEGNTPARAIAEKCGFEIEGKIRRDYKTTSGEVVDLIYYGRLA